MGQEIRKSFHEDLDEVKRSVARLTAMVTDAIPRGTAVLLANDLEGAQAVIEHDEVLNELSLEIEENCWQILALQQPVASEFRAMVTALRLNAEIERSGDLVANIAKATRYIRGATFSPTIRGLIERMSEEALRLNRAAIDAYLDGDARLAASIDEMDDTLDGLQRELIEAVFAAHEADDLDLEVAVQLALIARFYERIGDHAVTMGERVAYMVTGWLPEHVHGEQQEAVGSTGAGGASPPAG
jgi:phosphate transport system protein